MPQNDIPNSVLGKILSFEFLGIVFVLGLSWATLTSKVDALDSRVEEHKSERVEQLAEIKGQTQKLSVELNDVNRKLDVMGNNQQHFKTQIETLDKRLDRVLDILEAEPHR